MTRAAPARVLRPPQAHYPLAYGGLLLFTLMLYLRPNDLLPIGVFPIVKIVALAALVAFILEQPRGHPISVMPVELKYLLWLTVLMLLSIPLAVSPSQAFWTFFDEFLKVLLIFMLMINAVTSLRRLRRLLVLTTVSGTIIAVGSIYNFATGGDVRGDGRTRGIVGGMFENPNDLALALNMLIPIAVGLYLTSREAQAKMLHFGCLLGLIAGTWMTYSRAGALTFVVVGGVLLRHFVRRSSNAVLLAGLAALVLFSMAPARLLTLFDPSGDVNAAASATARWDVIVRSIEVASVNPLRWMFGVGMGNFPIVSIQELPHHNAYLQVFNEVGLPGMIVYCLFLFGALRSMGRIGTAHAGRVESRSVAVLARTIQASLIAYAVGSLFASVAYLWYLYYAAGFAVCLKLLVEGGAAPVRTSVSRGALSARQSR
jgi:O-Antigen ligase